jgi:hypothetical protein
MTGQTQLYGIRYPNGASKARDLGPELEQMAGDVERALQNAQIVPIVAGQLIACKTDQARNTYFGIPSTEAERLALQDRGPLVLRTDKGGQVETYYATYNASTNPQGAVTPGWYPPLGPPSATQTLTYLPTANITTPTSGSIAFPNFGNVNVPPNATVAHVRMDFLAMQAPSTALNVQGQVKLGNALGTRQFRVPGTGTNIGSYSWGFADTVALQGSGAQALQYIATFGAGTGNFILNTSSLCTARIDFR